LIGPYALEGNLDKVLAIIKGLRAQTPYLGFRALQLARWTTDSPRRYIYPLIGEFGDGLEEYFDANPFQLTPQKSLFLDYVQESTPISAPLFFWLRFQPDESSIDHPMRLARAFQKEGEMEMGSQLYWPDQSKYRILSDQPTALHDARRFLDQDHLEMAVASLVDSLSLVPTIDGKVIYADKDQTTDNVDQYYTWLLRDIVAHPKYSKSHKQQIDATRLQGSLPRQPEPF